MALYRCAACGSPNVVTDIQKEGYDYVKGAIGTAILGAGGAVAGINGKTARVFKCPDCGLSMSNPMPDAIKAIIDLGVMSADARKNLVLQGSPIEWNFLKSKYMNIERGPADEIEASRSALMEEMRNTKYTLEWQLALDYTSTEGKEILERARPVFDAEYSALLEQFTKKRISENEAKKAKDEEKLLVLREKQSQLKAELSSLGLFKFARKKEIDAKLTKLKDDIEYQEILVNAWSEDPMYNQTEVEHSALVVAAVKATGFALREHHIEAIAKAYGVPCLKGIHAIHSANSIGYAGIKAIEYEGPAKKKSFELYITLEH